MKCKRCGKALDKPKTGRPPKYCSDSCRKLTELRLRRLTKRLENLEDWLFQVRRMIRTENEIWLEPWNCRPAEAITLIKTEIQETEQALKELVE